MSLTPEQRAALNAVCAGSIVRGEFPTQTYESVFLAGLRMGRAEADKGNAALWKADLRRECDRTLPAMEDAYRNGGPFLLHVGARIIRDLLRALPEEPT